MRSVLLAVALMAGCGTVEWEAGPALSSTSTEDLLIPACADLGCDLVDCTLCFTCGDIEATCKCYWQGVPAAEGLTCFNPDAPKRL